MESCAGGRRQARGGRLEWLTSKEIKGMTDEQVCERHCDGQRRGSTATSSFVG